MTTSTVQTASGVESWCTECGSVAWFTEDDLASAKAEDASLLHDDNGHAPIWLDSDEWPTVNKTSWWAGGSERLRAKATA